MIHSISFNSNIKVIIFYVSQDIPFQIQNIFEIDNLINYIHIKLIY